MWDARKKEAGSAAYICYAGFLTNLYSCVYSAIIVHVFNNAKPSLLLNMSVVRKKILSQQLTRLSRTFLLHSLIAIMEFGSIFSLHCAISH